MPFPTWLYDKRESIQLVRKNNLKGRFDLNACLRGKPCWLQEDVVVQRNQPKVLILNDWTIASWDAEKRALFKRKFTELNKQGFQIFYKEKYKEKLTKLNIDNFEKTSLQPLGEKEINHLVQSDNAIARKRIQTLGPYEVEWILLGKKPTNTIITLHELAKINSKAKHTDIDVQTILENIQSSKNIKLHIDCNREYIRHIGDHALQDVYEGIYKTCSSSALTKICLTPDTNQDVLLKSMGNEKLKELIIKDMTEKPKNFGGIKQLLNRKIERLTYLNGVPNIIKSDNLDSPKEVVFVRKAPMKKIKKVINSYQNLESITIKEVGMFNFNKKEKPVSFYSLNECLENQKKLKKLSITRSTIVIKDDENPQDATTQLKILNTIEELDLSQSNFTYEGLIQIIKSCPNLKRINLKDARISGDANALVMANLSPEININLDEIFTSNLNYMKLTKFNNTNSTLRQRNKEADFKVISKYIHANTKIKKLSLYKTSLKIQETSTFRDLAHIEEIELDKTKLSCEQLLKIIKKCPKLKKIKLHYSDLEGDTSTLINEIKSKKITLEADFTLEADISHISTINKIILTALAKNILTLDIYEREIDFSDIAKYFQYNETTKEIHLLKCTVRYKETDNWEALKNIEKLDLSNSTISCEDLLKITKNCPNLKSINLDGTKLTGDARVLFDKKFISIDIHVPKYNVDTNINKIILTVLSKSKKLALKSDNISFTDITQYLRGQSKIEEISLKGHISTDGLCELPHIIHGVGKLDLSNSTLTYSDLLMIINKCPDIKLIKLYLAKLTGDANVLLNKNISPPIAIKDIAARHDNLKNALLFKSIMKDSSVLTISKDIEGEIDLPDGIFSHISKLNLGRKTININSLESIIQSCGKIESIGIVGSEFTGSTSLNIDYSQVKEISLGDTDLCRLQYEIIAHSNNLETLSLEFIELNDVTSNAFEKYSHEPPKLKKLILIQINGKGQLIENLLLKNKDSLENIEFYSSNIIFDKQSSHRINFPALKSLTLESDCYQSLRKHIGSCPQLENLYMCDGTDITLEHFELILLNNNQIKHITLSNCKNLKGKLNQLSKINFTNLEKLDFSYNDTGSADMLRAMIESTDKLERLSINYTKHISEIDFSKVNLSRIKHISVSCSSKNSPYCINEKSLEYIFKETSANAKIIIDADINDKLILEKIDSLKKKYNKNNIKLSGTNMEAGSVQTPQIPEQPSITPPVQEPPHLSHMQPHNNTHGATKYDKQKNRDLSQNMVINQLCQYIRIFQKDLQISNQDLNKISQGICFALSKQAIAQSGIRNFNKDYLAEIQKWDGSKQSLTENQYKLLTGLFKEVDEYYIKENKTGSTYNTFIGRDIDTFIQQSHCTKFILSNIWHAIVVEKNEVTPGYKVYDPNHPEGYIEIQSVGLLKTHVTGILGNNIQALGKHELSVKLSNINEFLTEGGLGYIANRNLLNNEALLKFVKSNLKNIKPESLLNGLTLYSNSNNIIWYYALNMAVQEGQNIISEIICKILNDKTLLENFIKRSNLKGVANRAQISELFSVIQKHKSVGERITPDFLLMCLNKILQREAQQKKQKQELSEFDGKFKFSHSPFSFFEDGSLPSNVFEVEDKAKYEHAIVKHRIEQLSKCYLQPWKGRQPTKQPLQQFIQHKVRDTHKLTQLIKVDSSEHAKAMNLALIAHCQSISKHYFYIDSPEDLTCTSGRIKRNKDTGKGELGIGSELLDFIRKNKDTDSVLIINYDNFSADQIVKFNSLIDDTRAADGESLPEKMRVIGVLDTAKDDCYTGDDFYSRFDVQEDANIDYHELESFYSSLLTTRKNKFSDGTENIIDIDLFEDMDWYQVLFGAWIPEGDTFIYKEGAIAKGLKANPHAKFNLIKAPWHDPEFINFWSQAQVKRKIDYPDGTFSGAVIDNIKIEPTHRSYAALSFKHDEILHRDGITLNPATFNNFFIQHELEKGGNLKTNQGYIQQCQGETLHVHLTRDLSKPQWAKLIAYCQKYHKTLHVHDLTKKISEISEYSSSTISSANTNIILSDDLDATITELDSENTIVIDISECEAEDLIYAMMMDKETSNISKGILKFKGSSKALVNELDKGKHVVLKGIFSVEIQDALESFLLKRRIHSDTVKGKLTLITGCEDDFTYFSRSHHQVDKQYLIDKITQLYGAAITKALTSPSDFFEAESFANLDARARYLQALPTLSSDGAWDGLMTITDGMNLDSHFDIRASAKNAAAFNHNRLRLVNSVLSKSPFVFLAGLSGVGKSTFVEKHMTSEERNLYKDIGSMAKWAEDKSAKEKILFIDEANLSQKQWSEFEGLYNKPPGILLNGKYYPLTEKHKVIFAGNPLSYSDDRQLASFFSRRGNTVIFKPLSLDVIHEKIIKPAFENMKLTDAQSIEISKEFLDVYKEICGYSTDRVLISPREVQMMTLQTLNYIKHNPSDKNYRDIAKFYAHNIGAPLVPVDKQKKFKNKFKAIKLPRQKMPAKLENGKDEFVMTGSREKFYQDLSDMVSLHEDRQQPGRNDTQKYGGLGGIIVEGSPGIGKTECVKAVLRQKGYSEKSDAINKFYVIPVSMDIDTKKQLLEKAFDEGAIVVIDEINSSLMMERLLNEMLMGKKPDGSRPKKPGFMVIGTQNPSSMAGRKQQSTALARRMIKTILPEYSKEECIEILMYKGISRPESESITEKFFDNVQYARSNNKSPIPNFRNLLKMAKAYKLVTASHIKGMTREPIVPEVEPSQTQPSRCQSRGPG